MCRGWVPRLPFLAARATHDTIMPWKEEFNEIFVLCNSHSGRRLVGLPAAEETELKVNGDRLNQRFVDLARFGRNAEGGMDRFAFSDADVESRPYLKKSMEAAGLEVHVDEAGNIFGRRPGQQPGSSSDRLWFAHRFGPQRREVRRSRRSRSAQSRWRRSSTKTRSPPGIRSRS